LTGKLYLRKLLTILYHIFHVFTIDTLADHSRGQNRHDNTAGCYHEPREIKTL